MMNEVLDLLRTRRSVAPHLLTEPGPTADELDALLTIAVRVPDHGRLTPWRFIVLEGDARRRAGETIGAAYQADDPNADATRVAAERNRLARAPLVVAVVSRARPHVKIPEWEQTMSAGAVCMSLVIAANAMGFGTSWLTEWYAFDRRILDALGLEPDETIAGFIHIGRITTPGFGRHRDAVLTPCSTRSPSGTTASRTTRSRRWSRRGPSAGSRP
jgi:nitroreductase